MADLLFDWLAFSCFAYVEFNRYQTSQTVVNLIKHFTIVIYDSRVVLTGKMPVSRL